MSGDGERQLLGPDFEPVHIRENRLLRRLRNARVGEHDVVASKEILKEVAAAVERLDLVDVFVKLHCRSASTKWFVVDFYTSLAVGSIAIGRDHSL